MSNLDITLNVSDIDFCPGPCNDKNPESIWKMGNQTQYEFKPKSGGRYNSFVYPLPNGGNLILTSLRICGSCCRRYDEFTHEEQTDDIVKRLHSDACKILEKLGKIHEVHMQKKSMRKLLEDIDSFSPDFEFVLSKDVTFDLTVD